MYCYPSPKPRDTALTRTQGNNDGNLSPVGVNSIYKNGDDDVDDRNNSHDDNTSSVAATNNNTHDGTNSNNEPTIAFFNVSF